MLRVKVCSPMLASHVPCLPTIPNFTCTMSTSYPNPHSEQQPESHPALSKATQQTATTTTSCSSAKCLSRDNCPAPTADATGFEPLHSCLTSTPRFPSSGRLGELIQHGEIQDLLSPLYTPQRQPSHACQAGQYRTRRGGKRHECTQDFSLRREVCRLPWTGTLHGQCLHSCLPAGSLGSSEGHSAPAGAFTRMSPPVDHVVQKQQPIQRSSPSQWTPDFELLKAGIDCISAQPPQRNAQSEQTFWIARFVRTQDHQSLDGPKRRCVIYARIVRSEASVGISLDVVLLEGLRLRHAQVHPSAAAYFLACLEFERLRSSSRRPSPAAATASESTG